MAIQQLAASRCMNVLEKFVGHAISDGGNFGTAFLFELKKFQQYEIIGTEHEFRRIIRVIVTDAAQLNLPKHPEVWKALRFFAEQKPLSLHYAPRAVGVNGASAEHRFGLPMVSR